MLSALRYLSADDFVDPPESGPHGRQLAMPRPEVTVNLFDRESHVLLRFGPPEKGEAPAFLFAGTTIPT
jgi:hypothetical protein